jgi:hypothetical protein
MATCAPFTATACAGCSGLRGIAGDSVRGSVSLRTCPGVPGPIPEVTASSLPGASTAPSASIAFISSAAFCANFEKSSWLKRQVHHSIHPRRSTAQTVEIGKISPMHLGTRSPQLFHTGIAAGEPTYLIPNLPCDRLSASFAFLVPALLGRDRLIAIAEL